MSSPPIVFRFSSWHFSAASARDEADELRDALLYALLRVLRDLRRRRDGGFHYASYVRNLQKCMQVPSGRTDERLRTYKARLLVNFRNACDGRVTHWEVAVLLSILSNLLLTDRLWFWRLLQRLWGRSTRPYEAQYSAGSQSFGATLRQERRVREWMTMQIAIVEAAGSSPSAVSSKH